MSEDLVAPVAASGQARLARLLTLLVLLVGLTVNVVLASRVTLEMLEARRVVARVEATQASRVALEPELSRLERLERLRDSLRAREEQLHAIAASRQLWSTKLARLGEIQAELPDARIDQIVLSRTSTADPCLTVNFWQLGTDLRVRARFRERLAQDPVFFTGFDSHETPPVTVQLRGDSPEQPGPTMRFDVKFVRRSP